MTEYYNKLHDDDTIDDDDDDDIYVYSFFLNVMRRRDIQKEGRKNYILSNLFLLHHHSIKKIFEHCFLSLTLIFYYCNKNFMST